MANESISFTLKVDPNYRALELGFLQGSNPTAYRRLMSFATVNAARTYAKPIKDAAPKGKTGNLAAGVKARAGRYSRPSAVVGPLFAGRGSKKNPWYRWILVKGTSGKRKTKNGVVSVKPITANKFVNRVIDNVTYEQKAIQAFHNTVEAFYNDNVFRGKILQFRRGGQLAGMSVKPGEFFGMIGRLVKF
ncbi:hypothetical protein UFOVP1573_39 [uncultured Caudovirales phage]|uniref:Uncharacterized protein n=1 Tax=uncultured Caudovirales phage TaxID=2100421 RepID=A0A6J5SKJ9_9CAUD|nr:hypothetical protein UFOVP1126_20 [uncultured Caudovirales phage]CAB4215432.1 hypothetical protein UFOVP1485_20 [uncultured Caudovirales phage]CAB5230577.1 hypothetical protein UFOVP1573_39 [uncultured Caudovirales phage]